MLLSLVLLLLGMRTASAVQDRMRFDRTLPESARRALEEARRSPGAQWAGGVLADAEDTYRRGIGELRRQESRFFLLRDMRPTAAILTLARAQAQEAASIGQQQRDEGRERARRMLAEVSEIMEMLDELETRASLPRQGRAGLSAARMGFVEASAFMEAGAYQEAESRAREVLFRARAVTESLGESFLRFADEERVDSWQRWIRETVEWSRKHKDVALVVIKEKNLLEVYRGGRKINSFPADMGSNNLAQKYRQGDRATPEGRYRIRQIKGRGQTRYYRALLLDYPTPEDLKRIEAAKRAGIVPAGAGPGALIEIHGEGGRGEDWTNGCVAVTNAQMDQLFTLVKVGTPVTIVGGDGTEGSFSSLAERLRRDP